MIRHINTESNIKRIAKYIINELDDIYSSWTVTGVIRVDVTPNLVTDFKANKKAYITGINQLLKYNHVTYKSHDIDTIAFNIEDN